MKISHIKISNILGIAELELQAGQWTEVSGRNGQGKTSLLEAIKAALQGGHDATLLRKGAESGEVVLVLDDGSQIRRRIKAGTSETQVRDPDGKLVQRPADALRKLADLVSVNPVEFLAADKKRRAQVLMDSMPMRADHAKLAELAGLTLTIREDVHATQVIDAYRTQVYDDRTGTNRAIREKEATINQLRAAMPDAPGGVEGDEATLTAEVQAADAAKFAELDRISGKLTGILQKHADDVAALKSDAQARIDAINAELQKAVQAKNDELQHIQGLAAAQRERTIEQHGATTGPRRQALAAIASNRAAAAKRAATLETIKAMEAQLANLQTDEKRQTKALADIDQYKADLLAALPIPGLTVVDGEVYRDGVHFDRLNTAQKVGIAFEIAKLRAGPLGVVAVDGLELLDPEAFEQFRKHAAESGLQLFVSRVTGEDFSVSSQ